MNLHCNLQTCFVSDQRAELSLFGRALICGHARIQMQIQTVIRLLKPAKKKLEEEEEVEKKKLGATKMTKMPSKLVFVVAKRP